MKDTEVKVVENKQENDVTTNEAEVRNSNNVTTADICATIGAIGLVTAAGIIVFNWVRTKIKDRKKKKLDEMAEEPIEVEEDLVTEE